MLTSKQVGDVVKVVKDHYEFHKSAEAFHNGALALLGIIAVQVTRVAELLESER